MAAAQASLWQQFVTQLRADRKRAAALVVLLIVLLVVCGRLVLPKQPQPVEADARALIPVQGGPITASPAAPPAAIPAPTPRAPETPPGGRSIDGSVSIDHLSRAFARDMFQTDWSAFALREDALLASARRAASSQPARLTGFWRRMLGAIIEEREQQEAHAREFEKDVAALHLQATFVRHGKPPQACINDRMLREGEIIGGFVITQISADTVVLRKSGLNVRLTMP